MKDLESRSLPVRQGRQYAEMDEKRSRTFMTASGMKAFRVQPIVNNSSLLKYQVASERTQRTASPQPLAHSTPASKSGSLLNGAKPKSARTVRSQKLSGSSVTSSFQSLSSAAPSPRSSGSAHSRTFNARSASCTPTHLYMNDDLRSAAKLSRPASSVMANKTSSSNENPEELIPTRFGKPITLPKFVKTNPHLKDDQLTMGQKQYLWGIARIYSVSKLKRLKQMQYQALLDHEFKRRLEKVGLKEGERVKEMKDYLRYTKYIATYEQRIPRILRSSHSPSEERVADHIQKHAIKGWSTIDRTPQSSRAMTSIEQSSEKGTSDCDENRGTLKERGEHIYKHVIKGWTMDPSANDVYRNALENHEELEHGDGVLSMTELEDALDCDKSVYRVNISRSTGKDQAEVVKITKLKAATGRGQHSMKDVETSMTNGETSVQLVSLKESTSLPADCNYL